MSLLELFTTAGAWASAAGAEHHTPSIHGIWLPLANFLIFAYLIKRFAIPPVRDFLRSRRQELQTSIQGAAESKQKAEAMVQDYQGRLARVDQEIQSIQVSLRAEGERQKAKILQEAAGMAANIRDDAGFLADQEVKIARQKIRKEMAEQAEARARELVQRHLSASDQGRLVNDFIQNIGQTR